jgi:aminoglycoside 6'-N-acetyltransferase I
MSATERVRLRAATEEDLADLVELTTAFYEEDGFFATREDLHHRFARFLREPDADVTVAETPAGVVGFALTTVRLILESGRVAELQDLYVQPGSRAEGIGSRLIQNAARWAREIGAEALEVVVAPNGRDMTHLHRYYRARGFVDESRRILLRRL